MEDLKGQIEATIEDFCSKNQVERSLFLSVYTYTVEVAESEESYMEEVSLLETKESLFVLPALLQQVRNTNRILLGEHKELIKKKYWEVLFILWPSAPHLAIADPVPVTINAINSDNTYNCYQNDKSRGIGLNRFIVSFKFKNREDACRKADQGRMVLNCLGISSKNLKINK